MYARTTTLQARPDAVDDLVARVRDEAMPTVMQLEGCIGLSMLADRETGRCVVTGAWETEEAMHASAAQIGAMRDRMTADAGATAEVDEWEIAVVYRLHRAGDGSCARVVWLRTDPDDLDRVVEAYRDTLMPWRDRTPGFASNSLLLDRRGGRCVSSVVFDSREDMAHTRDQFTTLREEFARRWGMEILEVAEFDLALHHLRVPETV